MRRYFFKAFICISLLLRLLTENAAATGVWTSPVNIQSIEVVGTDGGFVLYFTTQLPSPCNAAGPYSLYIYPNHNGVTADGAKMMLSAANMAFAMGKTVSVMYENDTAYCWGAYITVSQ